MDFDTFCKSDFRAVKVKACEAVKKSNKLLNFTLDDGTGTDRQILSGIAKWYKPEDLVGKTLVAIVNLPPRKMMGLESQATYRLRRAGRTVQNRYFFMAKNAAHRAAHQLLPSGAGRS